MLAVGYSDAQQAFIVRNSWGTDWVNTFFLSTNALIFFVI
jgi:hypothetical protein